MDPLVISMAEVIRFALVLFRVGGIMVFAPFYSSHSLPYQVRIVLTLVATVALLPSVPLGQVPPDLTLTRLLGLIVGESLVGLTLGLVSLFILAGLQLAGQIISFQLGFALINLIDPSSEVDMPVFSFLENYLGLLLFLLLNGHHWFFTAVSDSFNYLPVFGLHLRPPLVSEVIRLSSQTLLSGVQIAAPVLAVTIIADVALGIIGRVAPQINILIVGMPVKTLVGFICLGTSFFFLPQYLGDKFTILHRDLIALLHKLI